MSLHGILEALAGLELRRLACGNLDGLTGLRVASLPRSTVSDIERAQCRDRDPIALAQAGLNLVAHRSDRVAGIRLGQACGFGHGRLKVFKRHGQLRLADEREPIITERWRGKGCRGLLPVQPS